MEKIISLFQRNHDGDRLVRDEVTPGVEWVTHGEGVATQKFDGTCCLISLGVLYKRYEVKRGKTSPDNFESASSVDPNTGKQQGWVPVGDGPEDKYHREAFQGQANGTYELCGPKVQGNPEQLKSHVLLRHGDVMANSPLLQSVVPRSFNELAAYFEGVNIEGIVWHHSDGRMVKIKAKDFGIKRIIS